MVEEGRAHAGGPLAAESSAFEGALTRRIAEFLNGLGLPVRPAALGPGRFLPGIELRDGALLVDEAALSHPGDLLHEAGHLALLPPGLRGAASGELGREVEDGDAQEVAAIAWSYAAAIHLGIDPGEVFHGGGYRGRAQSLLTTFALGVYLGVPWLERHGLTRVGATGEAGAYPAMLRWLRC